MQRAATISDRPDPASSAAAGPGGPGPAASGLTAGAAAPPVDERSNPAPGRLTLLARYGAAALAGVLLGTAGAWALGWGTPEPRTSCTTTQFADGSARQVCHTEGRVTVDRLIPDAR